MTSTNRVRVLSVCPSTLLEDGHAPGAVDAEVEIDGETIGGVTLAPDKARPTVNGRHPLGTWGGSLDGWAAMELQDAIRVDRSLIGEIVRAVQAAADAIGLGVEVTS